MMATISGVNYIKIVEKDYTEFFDLINDLADGKTLTEASEGAISFAKYNLGFSIKDRKTLSEYKIGKLDKGIINSYKDKCRNLKHVRVGSNTCGEIIIDKENVVGYYNTENKDGCIWLQSFEIMKDYRGHGLGNKLLARALSKTNFTNLAVNIENEVAIRMYMNYGFVEYSRNDKMMLMYRP